MLLQNFLQSRKLALVEKSSEDHMWPAGRILCRPATNAHKP